ncbi:lytic transglycosylase domain-containing protein [bacterium]|nr:lytic transglycosylase domain-containing protein [bacterium]
MSRRLIALAVALLALPAVAATRDVDVPLSLDHAFVRKMLVEQVYTLRDNTVRVWDDGSGCNVMILSNPRVDSVGGRLRVVSDGLARVGTAVGNSCLTALDWTGTVEVLEEPTLDANAPVVRFRVVDTNLYGTDGKKRITGTVWDWVKQYVHPRFEAVTIDLAQPLAELRDFLPSVLPDGGERAQRLIDSLRLVGAAVTDAGLRLDVRFEVEEATLVEEPLAPGPEPTLSAQEIAAWNAAWEQWDAFVTFVAKNAAGDALAAQRQALFDVLIEARYDLLDALAPAHPGAPDPVRPLFVKTWGRLAPVLRDISLGLPGEGALRYLTFITAADALRAIDALGPSSGLDISADGLRRLARMIAPSAPGDPLTYDEAVDPLLRERFGFGPPPPAPAPNPDVDLSWLWPAAAWAAEPAARLNHWVPSRDDLDQYLPLVRELLGQTADATLDSKELKSEFHQLYRWLVLATAWKESCWRQFVRVNGRIRPMLSGAGAVGIMQVLPRVWRGFYEVGGLQQDIAYNARAGAEILLHYLRDYAVAKGEHTATGSIDNLARSTYAMYNGGPGQVRRYRADKVKRSLRDIDDGFWDKYRKVKAGNELAVAECY